MGRTECAWTLKEMLHLYTSADRAAAEAALADWHHHARAFDVETNRLAKTLAWEPELLGASPTGPPRHQPIIKAVKDKASATPTPTTTASASSTAADTLNPPDNRTPPAPPTA